MADLCAGECETKCFAESSLQREKAGLRPQTSSNFRNLRAQQPASTAPPAGAVEEIINFKTAAEKGIQTGKIKSIINPAARGPRDGFADDAA